MSHFAGLRRFFRLDRPQDVRRSVDEELRFHLDMTAGELMAGGMDEVSARAEAERRFGDVRSAADRLAALDLDRTAGERRAEWWGGFARDVRYALRGLRMRPGFTAAVVLTLGLGIGANATMFGIVDRLLLRPPAFLVRPSEVHRVYFGRTFDGVERIQQATSVVRLRDIQRWTRSFDQVAAVYPTPWAVGTGDEARELSVLAVSANFWRLFDARPALGRFFVADEDSLPETAHVAVLGNGYWRSRYGGRGDVIGQQLRVGRNAYTIIGVAPAGFTGVGLDQPAVIVPLTMAMYSEVYDGRPPLRTGYGYNWLGLVVRRRPGVSAETATRDLTSAFLRSYAAQRIQQPSSPAVELAKPRAIAAPIQRERGPNQTSASKVTLWLLGVSAIVLLIACANVGNLLLARTFGRRREIAVRLALGVSRSRLLVQLLTESVLLSLLGGLAGIAIAHFGGGILRAALLRDVAWASSLSDGRILAVTALLALAAGLATGLIPGWHAARSDVAGSLKAGMREGSYQRSRLRSAMLVLQSGLSVVLLVGAGLFVRSLRHALASPLGFDPDRVVYVEVQMREVTLDSAAGSQLRERLLERAATVPGVEHASRQATVPFMSDWENDLFVAGIDSVSKLGVFEIQAGTPDYFATMGTRLLRGRGIASSDRSGAPRVMVASRSMVNKLWPGREALGQCVRIGADTMPCTTVVGVAEDIKTSSLAEPSLVYYLPINQFVPSDGGLFVRVRGDAAAQAEAVRRALMPLMPGAAYVSATPLDQMVGQQRRSFQLGATMFTIFGALALLVASVGLYSVVSYGVAQRSHELGVRLALGAPVRDIVTMVVGDGLRVAVAAVAIGLGVAWAAGRWIAPLLFETSPRDPLVFSGVAVVLLLIALVASYIPARRAARVDPCTALRAD